MFFLSFAILRLVAESDGVASYVQTLCLNTEQQHVQIVAVAHAQNSGSFMRAVRSSHLMS